MREPGRTSYVAPLTRRQHNIAWHPLTKQEIADLEHNGNRCDDWHRLEVGANFRADRVYRNWFRGECRIAGGAYPNAGIGELGELGELDGLSENVIVNSHIGLDCAIHRCALLANCFIGAGCYIINTTIETNGCTRFGNGTEINAGLENDGRRIAVVTGLTLEYATRLLSDMGDIALHQEYAALVERYCRDCESNTTWIGDAVTIVNGGTVCNCWIGDGARIRNNTLLEDSTLQSHVDQPITIENGTILRSVLVQPGCIVRQNSVVERSLIMEYCTIARHAKLEQAIVGPNSEVEAGEVCASFVGPFLAMHHQSLLISAFWPGGRGNIGYGANVGSCHTSRVSDQEIWPGDGMFFGLSCVIKYPANYSESPHSIIASGVIMVPQRICYPFSLIMPHEISEPDIAPTVNRLVPAWNLTHNLYSIMRNWFKHESRNRARLHHFDFNPFPDKTVALMERAADYLQSVTPKAEPDPHAPHKPAHYSPDEIEGVGNNIVFERDRQTAIDSYRLFIEFARCSNPKRLREIHEEILRRVISSRARDYIRGRKIIPDYDSTHPPIEQDSVIIECRKRFAPQ